MQAYVLMVKLEIQRAEAEARREAEEREKRKEQGLRAVHMLEAAFDGDTIEIRSVLEEVLLIFLDSVTTKELAKLFRKCTGYMLPSLVYPAIRLSTVIVLHGDGQKWLGYPINEFTIFVHYSGNTESCSTSGTIVIVMAWLPDSSIFEIYIWA